MIKLRKVKLRKDRDYVYCFLREQVIFEEDCDMYEHNRICDEKNDVWSRTHCKGTLAGYKYQGVAGNVLNSCKYCLNAKEEYAEYIIPQEAFVNKVNNKRWKII